jgi:hypothetical protein
MKASLVGIFSVIATGALASAWQDQPNSGYDKSVIIVSGNDFFGHRCNKGKESGSFEYVLDIARSGNCKSPTLVTLGIDGVTKTYEFQCGGRDVGVLLYLEPDTKPNLVAMSEVAERIRGAKAKTMSVRTNITRRAMNFSLTGAVAKLDEVLKTCGR